MPLVQVHARTRKDVRGFPPGLEHGDVELNSAHAVRFRHTLLAAFGWYLVLFDHLKERDAAAAETALETLMP